MKNLFRNQVAEQSLQNSCFGCIIDCCEAHGNSNKGSKAWISFLLWPKCSNSCLENGKNVEDFFNIIWFLFNAAYLCFSLVLLVSKAHSLFVPALSVAQQKLLRMGTASCGAECSAHGTSTSCNDLKEGAEWVPAQGWPAWGSGVRGEEMYPRTAPVAGEVPTPATGQFWGRAGEWSECLTLSSASLACPWPSFPGGHPQNCHHLSPGNDFPYTCTQQRHRKVSLLTQRSRLLATSKLTGLQSVVSSDRKSVV